MEKASAAVRTRVTLDRGDNTLVMKLIQPADQRTRAYFAIDPPDDPPADVALRWFTGPSPVLPSIIAPPERRAIRLRATSPPGVREIRFVSRGSAPVTTPGDNTLAIYVANTLANHYSVGTPTPYAFPRQTTAGLLGPVTLALH